LIPGSFFLIPKEAFDVPELGDARTIERKNKKAQLENTHFT